MVETYKKFAEFAQSKNAQLELIAINMSKSKKQASALGVQYYPTIKLLKSDGN